MTVDLPEFYEEIRSRLDAAEIRELARELREALNEGHPYVADYQPGNSTRYLLVFTPAWSAYGADEALADDVGELSDVVLVSHVNGTARACHPFDLGRRYDDDDERLPFRYDPSYLQDKLRVSAGDAVAIHALLAEASL